MYLFLALILVPLTEIALFVTVGQRIGLAWTLAIVLATALIGSVTLRRQGLQTFAKLRSLKSDMEVPVVMIEGVMVAAAGILLLTPGFLTDAIGFLLLIPPVRSHLAKRMLRGAVVQMRGAAFGMRPEPQEPPRAAPNPPPPRPGAPRKDSPWADASGVDRDHADEAIILDDQPGQDDHPRR